MSGLSFSFSLSRECRRREVFFFKTLEIAPVWLASPRLTLRTSSPCRRSTSRSSAWPSPPYARSCASSWRSLQRGAQRVAFESRAVLSNARRDDSLSLSKPVVSDDTPDGRAKLVCESSSPRVDIPPFETIHPRVRLLSTQRISPVLRVTVGRFARERERERERYRDAKGAARATWRGLVSRRVSRRAPVRRARPVPRSGRRAPAPDDRPEYLRCAFDKGERRRVSSILLSELDDRDCSQEPLDTCASVELFGKKGQSLGDSSHPLSKFDGI